MVLMPRSTSSVSARRGLVTPMGRRLSFPIRKQASAIGRSRYLGLRMSNEATEKPNWPSRRRLYLMRHGDVSYFDAEGRPVRPDSVPLNENGLQQADAAR